MESFTWNEFRLATCFAWVACSLYIAPSALNSHDDARRETYEEKFAEGLRFWGKVVFAPYHLLKRSGRKNAQ